MALEEKTPDLNNKINELKAKFGDSFARLIFSIHPYGVEGEIPGKIEVINYAKQSWQDQLIMG